MQKKHIQQSQTLWIFTLIALLLLAFINLFKVDHNLIYSIWTDRDFLRADQLMQQFQFYGAELSDGGRAPGGMYYYYLSFLMLFSKKPLAIYYLNLTLSIITYVFLGKLVSKHFGTITGLFSLLLFFSSHSLGLVITHLWNPAFITVFLGLAYYCYIKLICENRPEMLIPISFILALGCQIHISCIVLFIAFCISILVSKYRITGKIWLKSLGAFLLAFTPFFIAGVKNGFHDITKIGHHEKLAQLIGVKNPSFFAQMNILFRHIREGFFAIYHRNIFTTWPEATKSIIILMITSIFLVFFIIGEYHIYKKDSNITHKALEYLKPVNWVILTVFIIISYYNYHPNTRNLMIAIPAVGIICGTGLSVLLSKMHQRTPTISKKLGELFFLSWIILFVLYSTIYLSQLFPVNNTYLLTYENINEILHISHEHYQFDKSDVVNKISIYTDQDTGYWEPMSQRYTAIEYLLKVSKIPSSDTDSNNKDCLLILRNPTHLPTINKGQLEQIANKLELDHDSINFDNIVSTGHFTYIPYKTAQMCRKSFTNAYVYTENEKQLLKVTQDIPAGQILKRQDSYNFKINVPGEPETKITVIKLPNNHFRFVLDGNKYRGFTGLFRMDLHNPKLVFLNKNTGDAKQVYFTKGTLGGNHNPISTPWPTQEVILEPGDYKFKFSADNIKTQKISLGAFNIVLDQDLKV